MVLPLLLFYKLPLSINVYIAVIFPCPVSLDSARTSTVDWNLVQPTYNRLGVIFLNVICMGSHKNPIMTTTGDVDALTKKLHETLSTITQISENIKDSTLREREELDKERKALAEDKAAFDALQGLFKTGLSSNLNREGATDSPG